MVSLGASAKQTGLIPSWLAVAGCALAVVALIPHEVALIGVRLSHALAAGHQHRAFSGRRLGSRPGMTA